MAALRITALVPSLESAATRYRVLDLRGDLSRLGCELSVLSIERSWLAFRRQCREIADSDVILLQKSLIDPLRLRRLRKAARVLIYDFDDAVYLRSFDRHRSPYSRRRRRRFERIVAAADAVQAGNRHLAEMARKQTAKSVWQVPTCVDPERYPVANHSLSGLDVRLVWIGSRSTSSALIDALPCLQALGNGEGSPSLRRICDAFPELPGVRCDDRVWSAESEASAIAECDIGISWLPLHPWSEGKCGLKVLQYMAAGLPVIGNRFAANREMIDHGRTGFLADTPREWQTAFAQLADSPELRLRMGQAGRDELERNYNRGVWAKRLADFYRQMHGDR